MKKILEHKGIVLLMIGALGLLIVNLGQVQMTPQETSGYSELLNTTTTEISDDDLIVEIKGEVLYPGIYQVSGNMRIGDVVSIAGGLTSEADITDINLAEKIEDEMSITIPARKQEVTTTFTSPVPVKIVVEIKGEVHNPGVYTMYDNTRVMDLVEVAGGFLDTADTSSIEMARYLLDGETVVIPELAPELNEVQETVRTIYVEIYGEVIHPGVYSIPEFYSLQDLIYEAGGVTSNCDLSKINWDVNLVLGASIYIPSYEDETPVYESGLININTASLETLITLPGIGDILGQRIIDYRAEYGYFLTIEDIMKVSGIKETIYGQIKDLITV